MTLRYPALAAVLGKKPWFNTPEKADQRWQARDEFHEIVAERDRYRAALGEIKGFRFISPENGQRFAVVMREIARVALEGEE